MGEMKAEGKTETGTPQVRDMGKEEGSHWLHIREWEEGIHAGKARESLEDRVAIK